MRSYRQYCGLAKALDVVGDRWTLLVVRELLIRGACRYTDLQAGLPGIATNLLAQRLVALERAGIVRREAARPPVATTLFKLTARGEELGPVIAALGRWAGPLLSSRGRVDTFRPHWLALPLQLYLTDKDPTHPPVTLELRAGVEPVTVETIDGSVRARPGPAASPQAVLTGAPELILGVLMGRIDLARARSAGLKYEGDPAALRRFQPRTSGDHTSRPGMNP